MICCRPSSKSVSHSERCAHCGMPLPFLGLSDPENISDPFYSRCTDKHTHTIHTPPYLHLYIHHFLHTMCQTECAHTSLIISRNTHLTEHKLLSAVMGIKEADSRLGGRTHHFQHLLPSWERWERSLRPPFKNELFVLHQQPQTLTETSCLQTREGGGLRFLFQRAVKSFNVKR